MITNRIKTSFVVKFVKWEGKYSTCKDSISSDVYLECSRLLLQFRLSLLIWGWQCRMHVRVITKKFHSCLLWRAFMIWKKLHLVFLIFSWVQEVYCIHKHKKFSSHLAHHHICLSLRPLPTSIHGAFARRREVSPRGLPIHKDWQTSRL